MNPNAIPTPSVEARPNGYVTRMSGGVRRRGREVSSYLD